tara:strand:- start:578 stop:733 length:156 start_codon:yes stop_codon:yes gene_type:complete
MEKIVSIISKDERLRLKAIADAKRQQEAIEERIRQISINIDRGLYDHIKPN